MTSGFACIDIRIRPVLTRTGPAVVVVAAAPNKLSSCALGLPACRSSNQVLNTPPCQPVGAMRAPAAGYQVCARLTLDIRYGAWLGLGGGMQVREWRAGSLGYRYLI
jgi:hypothetical protein